MFSGTVRPCAACAVKYNGCNMGFSWPRSQVALVGRRLVLAGNTETPSLAPAIAGFWMRLATLPRVPEEFAAFAGEFGVLRRYEEEIEDWEAMSRGFAEVAKPWGAPIILPFLADSATAGEPLVAEALPPPGIGSAAVLIEAQTVAVALRQAAISRGDIGLDAGASFFEIAPRTLAGFLVAQACRSLIELPGFKRCRWCGGWFAVGRNDQVFCCSRHRWQASNEKRERP